MITVLYFAWLKEKLQKSKSQLILPPNITTIATLVEYLAETESQGKVLIKNKKLLRYAINHEFADATACIKIGDEVAIFPPVTGG